MTVQIDTPKIIYSGKINVTISGTEVILGTGVISSVTIKALSANTGVIYVGAGGVSSANGFQLAAGDTLSIDISNLATVWIDSSINGEGVTYLAVY